ncbi:hypothetical protein LUCX_181 [Xanthomonas phage vB_XciM_LucasX]|nr:hypothetical protein LUCX_181 [Xanthomonas phage vB_XciM_LucasX]
MSTQASLQSPPSKSLAQWQDLFSKIDLLSHYRLRKQHIAQVGFPIVTLEVLRALTVFLRGRKVLDVGAGTGYLARLLSDRHINIRAVDNFTGVYEGANWEQHLYFDVEKVNALTLPELSDPQTVIIMSWPPYEDPFAYQVAQAMSAGQFLIYQGVWRGCTGDEDFHTLLETQFHRLESPALQEGHINFQGIFDTWTIFCKKPSP